MGHTIQEVLAVVKDIKREAFEYIAGRDRGRGRVVAVRRRRSADHFKKIAGQRSTDPTIRRALCNGTRAGHSHRVRVDGRKYLGIRSKPSSASPRPTRIVVGGYARLKARGARGYVMTIWAWRLTPDPLLTAHCSLLHQKYHQMMLSLIPLSYCGDESCGRP